VWHDAIALHHVIGFGFNLGFDGFALPLAKERFNIASNRNYRR
jgi:hypothetical protein